MPINGPFTLRSGWALLLAASGLLAAHAQQTLPTGNGYFIRTTDAARSVRYPDFATVVDNWAHPQGLNMTYLDDS
ncbi:MAG: hypothetical protein WBE38_08810, partial [Terracidiphilus sp.]